MIAPLIIAIISSIGFGADWVSPEHLNTKTVLDITVTRVESDGSRSEYSRREIKILTELGRREFSNQSLHYTSGMEKLRVISAQTINGNKIIPVEKKFIDERSIPSDSFAITNSRKITISFPNVQPMSSLYLEYEKQSKAVIPGFFSDILTFGDDYVMTNIETYESSEPLYIYVDDPESLLKIDRFDRGPGQKYRHMLTITQKEPFIREVMREPQSLSPSERLPRVYLSNKPNWQEAASGFAKHYEKQIQTELKNLEFSPQLAPLREIASKASKIQSGLHDQIDFITSQLNSQLKYFGDYSSITRFKNAQSLKEVFSSGRADCKEFSLATIVVLRKLGYAAYGSSITRGDSGIRKKQIPIPVDVFNHRIVYIELPGGFGLWIDPTNNVSYSHGIRGDISGRPALVYKKGTAELLQVPEPSSADKQKIRKVIMHFSPDTEKVFAEGEISYIGLAALNHLDIFFNKGKGEFLANLYDDLLGDDSPSHSQMTFDSFNQLTLENKPFTAKASGYVPNFLLKTSLESYLPVLPFIEILKSYSVSTANRKTSVHAVPPMYYQSQTLLKGIRFKKSETVLCDVRSKWMDFSFTLMNSPEGIVSSRLFHAKAEVIYYSEFESNDYLNLQEQASQCLEKQRAIPIEYISAAKP